MKKLLHIVNLDCPVCAEALQADIQKIKGVEFAQVDYVTQTISLEYADEAVLKKVVRTANAFEEVRVLDGGRYATKEEKHVKEWLQIFLSAAFLLIAILLDALFPYLITKILSYVFYAAAYLAVGYPVLLSTVKNIAKGRIFDENFLMTVASIGAVVIGEIVEGVAVMLLYQLGELLQAIAVGSSRRSVGELLELKSERATLLVDGEAKEVEPEMLKIGDTVLVKAGERAPADGLLISERATLDKKALTGEAEYVEAARGEEILSGSINVGNAYEMEIIRAYEDSAVGRILDLVENASTGKAKTEKFIARFAKYYTPIVCLLAVAMAALVPLCGGLIVDGYLHFYDLPRWVQSALTFLVISCPCALVISVPLTYFSGIGACAKRGILVKGATYLDVVAAVKTVALDKTGTLTEGNFTRLGVYPEEGVDGQRLLELASAVEKGSAHPIGKAFEDVATPYVAESVREQAGRGLIAIVGGEEVVVGNGKLFVELGIPYTDGNGAYTTVYVAQGNRFLGSIEIGDSVRKEARPCIERLKTLGVDKTVMLTGDRLKKAERVANEVGTYEVNAELLPDEKLKRAEELKKNGALMYVGDGINDAPVMMTADVSVSMGKLGSAAAIEASNVVLIADDLTAIPALVQIARRTRKIARQNVVFSLGMKVAFMALGALGLLPLWLAVFADVGVMLLAVLNSFRVRISPKK